MKIATILSDTVEQTAWSTAVLSVVFQNLRGSNGLQNLIKRDILLRHLLLSMLRDAKLFGPFFYFMEPVNMQALRVSTARNCPCGLIKEIIATERLGWQRADGASLNQIVKLFRRVALAFAVASHCLLESPDVPLDH